MKSHHIEHHNFVYEVIGQAQKDYVHNILIDLKGIYRHSK